MIKKCAKTLFFLLFAVQSIFAQTPPSARVDYDTAEINTTLTVAAPGVIANDTDLDADVLTVTGFTVNGVFYNAGETATFGQGTITIAADGSYTFIPAAGYTGDVPVISYILFDGTFTSSANLFLTVEHIDNLLEITSLGSCNQGFTANGEYKIRYSLVLTNTSTARDYHESSLIKNIDLTNNLQTAFGNGCIVNVDQVSVSNDVFTRDYVNNSSYPREFTNSAINSDFLSTNSNSIFSNTAINDLILYPRQLIIVNFCVNVVPSCNGRPNPTPSGSGIDFTNTVNVSSDRGNDTSAITLTDFHTTEAVVSAGLYVPEFNDSLNPPGTINPDGTYDYINTVVITNEGTTTASNVNYNMGLGSFFDNGINFTELRISQKSGPNVTVNTAYDGNTETAMLMPNNTLAAGQTVVLELFYLIAPYYSTRYSYFYQSNSSQTQGILDGFDESTPSNKRSFSFVTWSDGLGDHADRYYELSSATQSVSSELQCSCTEASMRFLFTSSSSTNKIISEVKEAPNGILEQKEITFQITIKNTSESVQLENLQLQDNLSSICGGNIVSVSSPFIESSSATTNPNLNMGFNGTFNSNLFDGSSGILKADETITVQFSVVFRKSCVGINSAFFTATNPLNNTVNSSSSVNVNASTDTDNDGITNTIDIDDDNDTIPDILEYNGLNPLNDDDADFTPNYRDTDFGADANNDGIVDLFDFDNDGIPNHFDLDSDNDGILDIVEAGNATSDTNRTGRTNNAVGANGLDNTKENNDSSNTSISYTIPNTDFNGNPNFTDIDADDDGIVDNIEAQLTSNYVTTNTIFSSTGIDTAYPNGIIPIDSENDGTPDYIDTNSDNDIRDDIIEGWDTNSDGVAETLASNSDLDNDGLDDAFDSNDSLLNPTNGQTPQSFPNADDADTPERDWREIIAILVLLDDISVTEGDNLVFTLTLVTKNDNTFLIESASPIEINFSTINGTDTTDIYDVATSPFDFLGFTNTVFIIAPLTNTVQFTVTSLEDPIYELIEFFTLNGAITSNNTLNSTIRAIGTILDNDLPPAISMDDSREDEGVDLMHTITLTNPCSTPIIIAINTVDDVAVSPADYVSISDNFTIEGTVDPNNANTQTSFNINTLLDNLNELDEEVLNVRGSVTTTNVGTQDLIKTGIIIDVDPNPLVAIEDVKVEEGNTLVFVVKLLNDSTNNPMQNYSPINLTLETIDDTTTANADYQPISKLTIIPAYTFAINQSVVTVNDVLNEETEALLLQATANPAFVSNTFHATGIGLIKDNDYPNLFSPNSDGKSDLFKISGIEETPNFKLTIYNRLGNEVYNYSNNGSTNPLWWNGTHKGKPVPVGVYFYTLDFNDGVTEPITSFIQLIR